MKTQRTISRLNYQTFFYDTTAFLVLPSDEPFRPSRDLTPQEIHFTKLYATNPKVPKTIKQLKEALLNINDGEPLSFITDSPNPPITYRTHKLINFIKLWAPPIFILIAVTYFILGAYGVVPFSLS